MFGFTEWIGSIEAKKIQPCNEIELYWSNNRIYRFLNIDSPHRPGEKLTCDDLRARDCAIADGIIDWVAY